MQSTSVRKQGPNQVGRQPFAEPYSGGGSRQSAGHLIRTKSATTYKANAPRAVHRVRASPASIIFALLALGPRQLSSGGLGPLLIGGAEFLHEFGLRVGEVVQFGAVGFDVVELPLLGLD